MRSNCVCTSSRTACIRLSSETATSRTKPRPLIPRSPNSRVICCAPASVVAVPATVAPMAPSSSATACPMPLLAPVMNASFPCSELMSTLVPGHLHQIGERLCVFQSCGLHFRKRATIDCSEHTTGSALDHLGRAEGRHSPHDVDPPHRVVQLSRHRIADSLRCGFEGSVDIVEECNRRCTHLQGL